MPHTTFGILNTEVVYQSEFDWNDFKKGEINVKK